jgi:hypothetical protein
MNHNSHSHGSYQRRQDLHPDPYHPTGVALPAILRRTLPPSGDGVDESAATSVSRRGSQEGDGTNDNCYWTADEMEEQMQQVAYQLQLIQKQIQRGEECYAEEASTHSIYKGWDGFIDARSDSMYNGNSGGSMAGGIGGGGSNGMGGMAGASSNMAGHPGMGPQRRMPADNRWFSNSFTDVASYQQNHKAATKPMGRFIPATIPKPTLASTLNLAKRVRPAPREPSVDIAPDEPDDMDMDDHNEDITTSNPTELTVEPPTDVAASADDDGGDKEDAAQTKRKPSTPSTPLPGPPVEKREVVASVPRKSRSSSSAAAASAATVVDPPVPTSTSMKRKGSTGSAPPPDPPIGRRTTKRTRRK